MHALVADDDRVFVELTAARLRGLGFDVMLAYDTPSAMTTATRIRPDLVLLDIMMPGGNGIQTLRRLKRLAPMEAVQIVVVTGGTDPALREQALEAGAAAFLQKPLDAEDLRQTLAELGVMPALPG